MLVEYLQVDMPSAFDVMMAAQQSLSRPGLPPVKPQPRHNKDILRNDVIRFLRDQDCLFKEFKETEISSVGSSLVQALTDTFWTIDGHHEVFSRQGFLLPEFTKKIVGYN